MVDTRCANPAYQLDVDTMMIEYTLYRAIEAQIQLLRSLSETQTSQANGGFHTSTESADAASRLTETYDTLINLFHHHHGQGRLSDSSHLNGDILRFLSLLNLWTQSRMVEPDELFLGMTKEMHTGLYHDQIINQFFRQRWLRTREGNATRDTTYTETAQKQRNSQLSLADHILPKFLHLSEHLLPHFMHLSYKMQPANAQLSDKWMHLASEFMVHSAIEILNGYGLLNDGLEAAKLALQECFAWGYVQRHRFGSDSPLAERILSELRGRALSVIDSDAEEACRNRIREALIREDDCWEMFYDSGLDLKPNTPQSSGELSQWTKIRQESSDVILTTFSAMLEETERQRHRPVQWLRNRYQLSSFLVEIADFVSVSWENLHSKDWHGKPILIQIEQGGIDGMSQVDFEEFKARASIQNEKWFG